MAVPRNRMSDARKNSRRANTKRSPKNIAPCKSCGKLALPHKLCANCHSYGGEIIDSKKEKKSKE